MALQLSMFNRLILGCLPALVPRRCRMRGFLTLSISFFAPFDLSSSVIGMPQLVWAVPPQEDSIASQHADRGLLLARSGEFKKAEVELRRAVQLSSNDPVALAALGGVLGMQQKLEEANFYLEKALKLDPNNVVTRRNLARNLWQLGRLQESKRNLEVILKTHPRDKPVLLLMGMVAENLKDYAGAVKWLESTRDLVSQQAESLAALARSYYLTNQGDKARSLLRSVSERLVDGQGHGQGIFLLAQVAGEARDYETAERLLMSIRASYPDTTTLNYNVALVQYRAGRYQASQETLLDLIGVGRETSEIYNLLGWSYHKQNLVKDAVRAFDHAISLEALKESNYLDLGTILIEANYLPVALEVAKKAIERIPKSSRAYALKGLIETRQNHYTEARQSYSQALERDPNSAEASLGLARAQWASGMNQESTATLEAGIRRFPQDALHYQELGMLLLKLEKPGDLTVESRATSLLEKALVLDSSLAESHFLLGNLALAREQAQEALPHLEAAAKLDPSKSKIHFALSRAYRRLGRSDEATEEMRLHEKLKAAEEKRYFLTSD